MSEGRTPPAPAPHGLLLAIVFLLLTGLIPVVAGSAVTAVADDMPGFVPGDEKPNVEGPVVQVSGGWMVPYAETLPGGSAPRADS